MGRFFSHNQPTDLTFSVLMSVKRSNPLNNKKTLPVFCVLLQEKAAADKEDFFKDLV